MTGAPIQVRHLRPEDIGAIVSVPKFEGWTGRLVDYRHVPERGLTFITLDDLAHDPFEHVLRSTDRVELDSYSEERLAMDGNRRLVVLEARAIQQQAAMFRQIPNEEAGR